MSPAGMNGNEYEHLQREYSKIATQYDTRWKFYIDASIRGTLQYLQVTPGSQALDVGCGTGVLLEILSLVVPQAKFAGVDLSEEMLQVARRRLRSSVILTRARAEKLPFDDATFDCVFSTNAFHFIREPLASLREMRRVLKPSGTVVITDWCDDYLACRVCDLFLRLFSRAHVKTYSSEECRRILADAGFSNVCVTRYAISWLWGLMTATAEKN